MSKRTVSVKSKKKGLSAVAQQIANAKDDLALAFDQIKNLVFLVKSLGPWKDDKNIITYRRLILATLRQKGNNKKTYIQNHVEPYNELLDAFKESILTEDITFLLEKTIIIQVGKQSKKGGAQLNLSEVYRWCMDNDEDDTITDIEAKLFYIFKHLSKDEDEKKQLEEICENFELEEDKSMQEAIISIVRKVKGSVGNLDTDTQPSVENLAPLIQTLVGDPSIHEAMGSLAKNLMNGKTDIAGLVNNVKKSVIKEQTDNDEDGEESGESGEFESGEAPELVEESESE